MYSGDDNGGAGCHGVSYGHAVNVVTDYSNDAKRTKIMIGSYCSDNDSTVSNCKNMTVIMILMTKKSKRYPRWRL